MADLLWATLSPPLPHCHCVEIRFFNNLAQTSATGENPGRRRLRWLAAATDKVCQAWDGWLIGNGKPTVEIIPEGDAQLGASLGQAEECVTAVATDIAPGGH
jgi:hypothetical protein